MKIALISNMTPAAENIRGTSALPYHLLIKRPSGVDVVIYTFNINNLASEKVAEVEQELNLKINFLNKHAWIENILGSPLGIVPRLFSRYPLHCNVKLSHEDMSRIKAENFDGIFIYNEELGQVSKQFAEYKRVHCFPDSEALYYKRMMEQPFVKANKLKWLRQWLMYPKFARLEREMDNSNNIHYYFVGQGDVEYFKTLNPKAQAHFIRHPHYDVREVDYDIDINFDFNSKRKIRLLVAGRNDYYMQQDAERAVEALCKNKKLASDYSITFLGKGWENPVEKLRSVGYDVNHIVFAPNYIDEIRKYDIQLTPISIGTGTKGKVLDALANGLLVIGTWFALENIAVENGKSCIEYHSVEELMEILAEIPGCWSKYKSIANAGRNVVLTEHSREKCSKELFELFK